MKTISIDGKCVGDGNPVYVIAEIGGNFREFDKAKEMIDSAQKAGVDAVKLQNYTADTLASRRAIFEMENTGVVSQYDLFKKYEMSIQLTEQVVIYCREKHITVFSTPSHQTDVDMLEKLNMPAYKIGSDDAVNIPLLRYIAKIGKPILLSTGMCTMREVEQAVDAVLGEGNDQLLLFHCTTNYPTHLPAVNLKTLVSMKERFELPVGYSDHTIGTDVCYVATVLGASAIEFHYTYDKRADGPDHMLSKDSHETELLVRRVRDLPVLMGDGIKRPAKSEMITRRNNRKSIIITMDIRAGEKISPMNIDIKRPGFGVACEHYYNVIGKTATRDLKKDDPLDWSDIS